MLRVMRKHASRWVLGILCGIITIAFVFTFGFNKGGGNERIVAEVGPYKITLEEYSDLYNRTANYYRARFKDKFDDEMKNELKLKERVMEQLVDRYLLLKQADEMGIRVSDKEFSEYLNGIEFFRRDGKFDEAIYFEFLKRNNRDPKAFEQQEKESMAIAKLMSVILDNDTQTDEDAAYRSYIKERGQVKFSVAVFDPAEFRDKVTVDDKELNDLYEKEKGAHKSDNTYQLKYMVIDETAAVKDDQVYMDLLKSKDMSKYSRTKGVEVIDLGTVGENELNTKFGRLKLQERFKGMGKGDVSLPIREGSKSYIFYIVDRQGGTLLDKAEVVKLIKARLIDEKAKSTARLRAEDAIKAKNVAFRKETPLMARSSMAIQGIGRIPKDHVAVFALSKGQTYEKPVEIDGKYYLFSCTDEKQPGKEQWEKEKEAYKPVFAAITRDAAFTKYKDDLKKKTKVKVDWGSI